MGSGSSNLSSDQQTMLTKELMEKFELYKSQKLTNEEIQQMILVEFNRLTRPISPEPLEINTVDAISSPNSKLKGPSIGFKSPPKPKTAKPSTAARQRRKSYDITAQNNRKEKEAITKKELDTIPVTSNETMDSWDSVTQQPYCHVCRMAFKSFVFLERHNKFSDLHEKNLKKNEEDLKSTIIEYLKQQQEVQEQKLPPKPIEGIHFKLLYAGSKLFWKTKATVDINIYHHVLPAALEVITFDTIKHKEYNRLYFDYNIVHSLCAASGKLDEVKEEIVREIATDRFAVIPEENYLKDAAMIKLIDTFILQRLQQVDSYGVNSDILVNAMTFLPLSHDCFEKNPSLSQPPTSLIPVNISRRRKSNTDEVDAVINGLQLDQGFIKDATSKAERISNLIHACAYYFASKHWWADLSPIRRKWVWSIRRVIRMNNVARTKEMLARRKPMKGSTKGRCDFEEVLLTNSKRLTRGTDTSSPRSTKSREV